MSSDDPITKNASVDVLTYIVEYSPSAVREYTLSQVGNTEDHDSMLINIMIEQVICDTDPELARAVQLMSNLRLLIDPENMLTLINKTEKTEFLTYFYKHSVQLLIGEFQRRGRRDSRCRIVLTDSVRCKCYSSFTGEYSRRLSIARRLPNGSTVSVNTRITDVLRRTPYLPHKEYHSE